MPSREIKVDGGDIYVRRLENGAWMVLFTPDLRQYPKWDSWTVEHVPATPSQDSLIDVLAWARDEWRQQKASSSGA